MGHGKFWPKLGVYRINVVVISFGRKTQDLKVSGKSTPWGSGQLYQRVIYFPTASLEILHHTLWRTCFSDERWLYYLTHTFLIKRLGECTFWTWGWMHMFTQLEGGISIQSNSLITKVPVFSEPSLTIDPQVPTIYNNTHLLCSQVPLSLC